MFKGNHMAMICAHQGIFLAAIVLSGKSIITYVQEARTVSTMLRGGCRTIPEFDFHDI